MNNIEFKLLRESLHLTRQDLADIWGLSSPRVIQRWDKGDLPVPVNRQEELKSLDNLVEETVKNFIDTIILKKERFENIDIVCVIAYNATNYDGDFLHYKLHNAVLMRSFHELKRKGILLKIVEFDRKDYLNWLGKKSDTQAMRSAWATNKIDK